MIADTRSFVACDRCDYNFTLHTSATRDFTHDVYDFGNGILIPLLRRRDWCLDCNTMAWVEDIPTESQISMLLERFKKDVDEFTTGINIWLSEPLNAHYQSILRNQDIWRHWAHYRNAGQYHQYASRCLKCGCQQLGGLDQSVLDKGQSNLAFVHPGCGGNLYVAKEKLAYHANPVQQNSEAPIDWVKYTPSGFPIRNLRKEIDEEYSEIASMLYAVVASEAATALAPRISMRGHHPRTVSGAPVQGEDQYPEIGQMVRAFVREDIAGRVPPPYQNGNLSYEYPELYGMFCQEARRMIAIARTDLGAWPPPPPPMSKLSGKKMTALNSNPFAILGASVRDDSRKILELAEEKSISFAGGEYMIARSDLTTPSKRLAAEVGWLPGLAPKHAERMVAVLQTAVDMVRRTTTLSPMPRANLIAAAIEMLDPDMDLDLWCEWIEDLARTAEEIDADVVLRDINEDRSVAGFPPVQSIKMVETAIAEQKKRYTEAVRIAIDAFDTDKMIGVVTKLIDDATISGEFHAPQIIHDLVERYEVETLRFLELEAGNISKLIEIIKETAPKGAHAVAPLVDKLDTMIRNWDRVAQPIQLSAQSRGVVHQQSHDVAHELRNLGIDLNNEHGMLDQAHKMTQLLQEVFAELPEFVEKLGEDAETIEGLRRQAKEREKDHAKWARDISFSAGIGMFFKDELSISPDGIKWKGTTYPLESITAVRWGAVRNTVNGIPTGTDYTIAFASNRSSQMIELKKESTYSGFIEALWRAVCVRLIFDMISALEEGKVLEFGDIKVTNDTVTLTKHKLFGANEKVRLGWHDVQVWSADGNFVIGKNGDKKTYGSASYIQTWNTHILEHVVRGAFKKGARKLSDYIKD